MFKMKEKDLALLQYLVVALLIAMLVLQSCSKNNVKPPEENPDPTETETLKMIPDSMFREYLKANVCPNAFDKTGKFLDITHNEVKNFTGTMTIDTITCPSPYVASLKGIEHFQKMTKLMVWSSAIDSLSITKTMALDTVRLYGNKDLQHVNVSGLTNMRFFKATNMPVVSLDLSNLPSLEYATLQNMGRLEGLKLENDGNLRHLITSGLTGLKTVNTSTNPQLRRLYLEYAYALKTLDVTHNPKLRMLMTSFCYSFASIDLSKNDSLTNVMFDDSNIDSIDFSHNSELISVAMMRTPLRNLSFLSNPKLVLLYLDGCTQLKTVDLRAQASFDNYIIDQQKYRNMSNDEMYQVVQTGFISRVQSDLYPIHSPATRAGVNGATINLFGGLRLPIYPDAGALSLTNIKVNNAIKDNYSLVMSRRVLGMDPPLITVYGADKTTVLCNDYDPKEFKCN
jgi:hypothetical protein